MVHGGHLLPINLTFNAVGTSRLGVWLASAGYAVLWPNYRGGTGRGEKFASAARGGMGTLDYDGIITLVKAGTEKGFINKTNVAIGE